MEAKVAQFRESFYKIKSEVSKVIVGMEEVIEGCLFCLFADGHVLLEGVPGLGKTSLVKALSQSLSLISQRVSFTPDMMPADKSNSGID